MNPNVDLRQLAVRREASAPRRRSRHVWTRFVLPGVVLAGFVAVFGWAARDSLLPARSVTVVPVMTTRMEVQTEGTSLFQSAGWVEPRPTPILVTALTEGVVEKMFVVEGQKVKAGDKVARLIEADAALALQAAEADLELRQAELENSNAALKAARTNLEKPVHLQAALGEAEATVAQKETELAALPFQITVAKAKMISTKQSYAGKKQAASSGALAAVDLIMAKSEFDCACAVHAELEQRDARLKRELDAQKQRRDALRQRLDLKTDEMRAVGESEANVKASDARRKQADVALAAAKLRFERLTIKAPVDGQIMSLVARPGMRVMGLAPGAFQDASTVVTMYDPTLLQVRADVRLEDVPRVLPGQRVRVDTPAAPKGPLEGEVLQVTSQADIQKNTLQVKVAIKAPPPSVRPEMLVQVTFLAPASPKSARAETQPLRLLIPRLLVETGQSGSRVWVADIANKLARLKSVKLGVVSDNLVEVVDGLTPADRLISGGREGLTDGQRIAVAGEEK
ncbi:MAG: efflux RND transporter periplasmic adaptor subunit [Planctomycetes bacterium]|nr:efflux RND transporter periplasmic adaptor subunit [Planctomycetota bacterium]